MSPAWLAEQAISARGALQMPGSIAAPGNWQARPNRLLRLVARCALALLPCSAVALASPLEMATIYATRVDQRLDVPADEAQRYAALIDERLQQPGLGAPASQYVVLVDRSPLVQAVFVYFKPRGELPQWIGASPASTGRTGRFDHFETPTGVFPHTLVNPDFRAEGSRNARGIRGYGVRGMRVFDFGWQAARQGWGAQRLAAMRLQMHATDPAVLERRLGSVQSKGCVRIPASLDRLIDQYGLLDADYDQALAQGKTLWVLRPQRQPTPWSGRYLIILESQRQERPAWAPLPLALQPRPMRPSRRKPPMQEPHHVSRPQ